jgi:nitrogen fixation protein FixH
MPKTQSKSGSNSAWKIIGIVIAVLGVAIMAYGVYGWLARPSYSGIRHAYPVANATYNQTSFNATAARRLGFGAASMRPGPYEAVIGLLTALLGVMVFKYAALKASIAK